MALSKAQLKDAQVVKSIVAKIQQLPGQFQIMEVCGGQTHSIVRNGIDQLLDGKVTLLHGPGCPVCVTPSHVIDQAIQIAQIPNTIICTYGDMMRVAGSGLDLLAMKARGANVRIIYSGMEVLTIAEQNIDKQVVFFGVGFETTSPMHAALVLMAEQRHITNISWLFSHYCVPPVLEALLSQSDCPVQGFLAAGHVCTVMGTWEYEAICEKYHIPIAVCGFEPVEILSASYSLCQMIAKGEAGVSNDYKTVVKPEGNERSQQILSQVFDVCDQPFRGLGTIPSAGFELKQEYRHLDARRRFALQMVETEHLTGCQAGEVLRGRIKPNQCPLFGVTCDPDKPKGAPMVSGEGACAAYYRYRRTEVSL